jgi:DNA-binding transcriptional LysR family regulator
MDSAMTLVQLKHLIELARQGSFSKTADKLHLTQPALSRSIKSLEDELGQPLFDRVGRKNELTAFGQHIVAHAQHLVDGAHELRQTGQRLRNGEIGQVRIGLGSGPGALLMTPLLMHMARMHPKAHIDISRGSTELLVQSLRERRLDALAIDIRSLKPTTDLHVEWVQEMEGAFMCRKGHPLAKRRKISLEMVRVYPVASTPLSDEVARILMERYGPQAHPDALVNLRCEEISSLLEVARHSDAVVLAIRAAAPDLVPLPMTPALNAKARFGWVTLKSRTESPLSGKLKQMVQEVVNAPNPHAWARVT